MESQIEFLESQIPLAIPFPLSILPIMNPTLIKTVPIGSQILFQRPGATIHEQGIVRDFNPLKRLYEVRFSLDGIDYMTFVAHHSIICWF